MTLNEESSKEAKGLTISWNKIMKMNKSDIKT